LFRKVPTLLFCCHPLVIENVFLSVPPKTECNSFEDLDLKLAKEKKKSVIKQPEVATCSLHW